MAKSPIKPVYILMNEDLGELVDTYTSLATAKAEASDLNEDFTYAIYEAKKILEEDSRAIVWKEIA